MFKLKKSENEEVGKHKQTFVYILASNQSLSLNGQGYDVIDWVKRKEWDTNVCSLKLWDPDCVDE